jgi:acyl-CoA thioesterase
MQTLEAALAEDRFARANGIEVIEVRPGYARARMTAGEHHLNSVGLVHGGAIFTLASVAFFAACNAAGRLAVGINLGICYIQSASGGTLEAEATEIGRSRKISTCTVRVADGDGNIVAQFQGTAYIKSEPFPPSA